MFLMEPKIISWNVKGMAGVKEEKIDEENEKMES